MFILLATLWFIAEVKYVLFWVYLWQLKDYHVGRFVDHFRTYKGKKIFLNPIQAIKLLLLILFLVFNQLRTYSFAILFLLYFGETVSFLKAILSHSVKKPKKTIKTLVLTVTSLMVVILFFSYVSIITDSLQPARLLVFDVLISVVVSVIILLFQPSAVFIRNNILKKAKRKLDKIKFLSKTKIVAITGSYGKTSTKEFLSTILSERFKVLSTKEHQNSEVGIANCILKDLKPSHQIFVVEVGAYNKGKVKEVSSILNPQIGIVTGVNEQHMALFGSLENLLSAEGGRELANALPKDGMLIVNGDNKYCIDLFKIFNGNKKIYSLSDKIIVPDFWAEDIEVAEECVSFVTMDRNKELSHFKVNVLGKHNVQNLLGAILVAKELGMSFEEISIACQKILPEQAGMVLKNNKNGIKIIDSSYSANPDGVLADLEYLSIFRGKKVVVMPCLIELGEKSPEVHEKIGRKIGEICDLAIITTKDKFEDLEGGFNITKKERAQCLLCDNPKDVYSLIKTFCKPGDIVLLEGRVQQSLINLLIS